MVGLAFPLPIQRLAIADFAVTFSAGGAARDFAVSAYVLSGAVLWLRSRRATG